jgi:hypothetical protein
MILTVFLVTSLLAFFISGISVETTIVSLLMAIVSICFGTFYLIKNKVKISFPKHFGLGIIVALIFQIYLVFIPEKFNPFIFSATWSLGMAYWLIFYNLKNGPNVLSKILLTLLVIYSVLYFVSKVSGNTEVLKIGKLYFQNTATGIHWDIGDLWAISLVYLVGRTRWKFDFNSIITVIAGLYFLAISNVRTAYLSLIVGVVYLAIKSPVTKKIQKIMTGVLVICASVFIIYISFGKSLLFSRPYFFQSLVMLPKHPLGVGMVNFKQISTEFLLENPSVSSFSLYTHNIVFEAISGIGIFSILFIIFIALILKDALNENKNISEAALLIAVLFNFMFDFSYIIPALIWLMFVSLGTMQSKQLDN